jgi:hypothetical protein
MGEWFFYLTSTRSCQSPDQPFSCPSRFHPCAPSYGLGYSIHDSYLRWVITSQNHMKSRELRQSIAWACGEVRGMMERADSQQRRLESKL